MSKKLARKELRTLRYGNLPKLSTRLPPWVATSTPLLLLPYLQTNSIGQLISLSLLAVLFIAAGVNHFVSSGFYLKIMPGYLPLPLALVYLSGFFEVLGGIGVAVPKLRWYAGWGLIALLVAVFPANVHMVVNAEQFPTMPLWALVARLPLQGVLIAWVWWTALKSEPTYRDKEPIRKGV